MRYLSAMISAAVVILHQPPAHATEEAAKAIIRDAIKACGGPTGNEVGAIGVHYLVKPSVPGLVVDLSWHLYAVGNAEGSLAIFEQRDQQSNMKARAFLRNGELRITNLENGITDQRSNKKNLQELNQYRALWLLPLLRDKQFHLSKRNEPDPKNPAMSQVTAQYGKQDLQLFFDKTSKRLHSAESSFYRDQKIRVEFSNYAVTRWHAAEEKALRTAGLSTKGPDLLSCVKQHIPDQRRLTEIRRAISQLADSSFAVRETAGAFLRRHGLAALPLLQAAPKEAPLEAARRINRLLADIKDNIRQEIEARRAAIRLIGYRQPESAEVVLRDLRAHAVDKRELLEIDMVLATISDSHKKQTQEMDQLARVPHRVYPRNLVVAQRLAYRVADLGLDLELVELELFSHLDEAMLSLWTSDNSKRKAE